MAVPSRERISRAFVYALSDKNDRHLHDITEKISKHLKLTTEDLQETMPDGENKFYYNVRWVGTDLYKARLVERPKTGIYRITSRGIKALQDKPANMYSYLRQYEEYRLYELKKNRKKNLSEDLYTENYIPDSQDITLDDWLTQDVGKDKKQNKEWTEEETVLALYGYRLIPLDKQDASNPEIQKLSKLINHTPESIINKMSVLASLDSQLHKTSSPSATVQDKEICSKYPDDNVQLFSDTKKIFQRIKKTRIPDVYPKMLSEISTKDTEQTVEVHARKHQSQFRTLILSIYDYKCCITGLRSRALLEASHIVGWSDYKEHRLKGSNGLCINSLFHKAYDRNLVSVTPDYIFKVDRDLIEYEDPFVLEMFMHYHNKKIYLPDERYRPDKKLLAIHHQKFNGK